MWRILAPTKEEKEDPDPDPFFVRVLRRRENRRCFVANDWPPRPCSRPPPPPATSAESRTTTALTPPLSRPPRNEADDRSQRGRFWGRPNETRREEERTGDGTAATIDDRFLHFETVDDPHHHRFDDAEDDATAEEGCAMMTAMRRTALHRGDEDDDLVDEDEADSDSDSDLDARMTEAEEEEDDDDGSVIFGDEKQDDREDGGFLSSPMAVGSSGLALNDAIDTREPDTCNSEEWGSVQLAAVAAQGRSSEEKESSDSSGGSRVEEPERSALVAEQLAGASAQISEMRSKINASSDEWENNFSLMIKLRGEMLARNLIEEKQRKREEQYSVRGADGTGGGSSLPLLLQQPAREGVFPGTSPAVLNPMMGDGALLPCAPQLLQQVQGGCAQLIDNDTCATAINNTMTNRDEIIHVHVFHTSGGASRVTAIQRQLPNAPIDAAAFPNFRERDVRQGEASSQVSQGDGIRPEHVMTGGSLIYADKSSYSHSELGKIDERSVEDDQDQKCDNTESGLEGTRGPASAKPSIAPAIPPTHSASVPFVQTTIKADIEAEADAKAKMERGAETETGTETETETETDTASEAESETETNEASASTKALVAKRLDEERTFSDTVGGGSVRLSKLFPWRLHQALDQIERDGRWMDVVSWMPHGRGFRTTGSSSRGTFFPGTLTASDTQTS